MLSSHRCPLDDLLCVSAIQKYIAINEMVIYSTFDNLKQVNGVGQKVFQSGDTVIQDVFLVFCSVAVAPLH